MGDAGSIANQAGLNQPRDEARRNIEAALISLGEQQYSLALLTFAQPIGLRHFHNGGKMEFKLFVLIKLQAVMHNNQYVLPHIFFQPNMAVKGTRRTQAFLKVDGLFGFVGFALARHPARPLLLR